MATGLAKQKGSGLSFPLFILVRKRMEAEYQISKADSHYQSTSLMGSLLSHLTDRCLSWILWQYYFVQYKIDIEYFSCMLLVTDPLCP